MSKKLLTLALALLMVVAVFAGCAQTPSTTPAPADDATQAPEAEDDATPAPDGEGEGEGEGEGDGTEPEATLDFKEPQVLELSCWDVDNAWGEDVEIDAFGQFIMEKFNVTFTTRNVTWGDVGEKYNLWAASNDLPATVCNAYVGGSTYYQWINEGVVRALPDDMSMYPTLNQNLQLGEVTAYKVNDQNWFLPRMTYADPKWWCMDRGVYYRKDWLEALDMEIPTNEEEFIEMCVAFQTQDPDGNGKNDTIGLSAVTGGWVFWSQGFANYGQTQGNYVLNADGTVSVTNTGEQAYKIACMLREINKRGGFDPDYMTYASDDDVINKFAAGLIGVFMKQISPTHVDGIYRKWLPQNPDKEFTECVGFLPLWDTGVEPVRFGEKAYWSETYFGNKVTDEELPRYLALFDWMASEEGVLFMGFGFEGEDYTMNEDGTITSLMPVKEDGNKMTLADKYPNSQFSSLSVWTGDNNQYRNPDIDPKVVAMCVEERDRRIAEWADPQMDWDLQAVTTDAKNENTADPVSDWMKMVVDTSDKSNEEWYEELKANWSALGLDAALESIAEAYAAE